MAPHTLVVDFAVALLITSVTCDLLASIGEEPELRVVATWTLYFGATAAALSVLSGYSAASVATEQPLEAAAAAMVVLHRNLGIATALVFGCCAAWRGAAGGAPPARRAQLYWLLTAFGATVLLLGAFFGGSLVFRHGVGVATGSP